MSDIIATAAETEGLLRPEFLRLPPPGQRCPITGMTRSSLNALILASAANGFKPPVRSFCLKKPGAKTGIRLLEYSSLASHIRANVERSS